MAKAQLTTKSGTLVTIEGSAEEVAKLIDLFDGVGGTAKGKASTAKQGIPRARSKDGLADQLGELIHDRFFRADSDHIAYPA